MGLFDKLKNGLAKTRDNIAKSFDNVFTPCEIDDDFYDEIEELLIMSDVGVNTTGVILDEFKEKVKSEHLKTTDESRKFLMDSIKEQMTLDETAYDFEKGKAVILVIGVNGVGKTTSIGKLAAIYKKEGKKVMMAAADTFRAAAGEQLSEWANRAGVDIVRGSEGQDPASVVFDALRSAKAKNTDMLICDTAGRLHNKKNLMEELKKIHRIIDKEYPEALRETLVVIDGTTGQNGLIQAREFHEAADATGIIMTKLDGTAKGGIAIAVQSELNIPVKFIGVGEGLDDLQRFDPDAFVEALFASDNKDPEDEAADDMTLDAEDEDVNT
ncbi:MAG: signal recognition particle-docking protein FtsY [Lachnospiraceae bacterium]|nr:signal recognition particle-docking protein FtsY [Lachnospiraceae bacterium]